MTAQTIGVACAIGLWVAFLAWRVINVSRYRPEDDPMYQHDLGDRE